MRAIGWAGAVIALAAGAAQGQEVQRPEVQGKNTVTLFANLGYEWNVSAFPASGDGLDRTGPAASLRVMWHPQYLLSFGFEAGYTRRFSVKQSGSAAIDATSNAWPFFLVLSMSPARRFLVNLGIGPVISTTTVTALGTDATSYSGARAGFMASAAYLWPVSSKFDAGAEFRFLRAEQFNDDLLSLSLTVAYRLSGK
jgi:opacity protein-like surface antigen